MPDASGAVAVFVELSAAAESSGTCVESSMRVATGRSDEGEASLRVIASGGLGSAMIGSVRQHVEATVRHHVEATSILMHEGEESREG